MLPSNVSVILTKQLQEQRQNLSSSTTIGCSNLKIQQEVHDSSPSTANDIEEQSKDCMVELISRFQSCSYDDGIEQAAAAFKMHFSPQCLKNYQDAFPHDSTFPDDNDDDDASLSLDDIIEPEPFDDLLVEGHSSHDSLYSKKRTHHDSFSDSAHFEDITALQSDPNDPFEPRPIVRDINDALGFVDNEKFFHRSGSTIDTVESTQSATSDGFRIEFEPEVLARPHPHHPQKRLRSEQANCLVESANCQTLPATVDHLSPPSTSTLLEPSINTSSHSAPTSTNVTSSSQDTQIQQPLDHATLMGRLETMMFKSVMSQTALQNFDKSRGLPKSHCTTMVKSSRSRKQLLEGKIIKKWNGTPLLDFPDDSSIGTATTVSGTKKAAKGKTKGKKKETSTPETSTAWKSPKILFEPSKKIERRISI